MGTWEYTATWINAAAWKLLGLAQLYSTIRQFQEQWEHYAYHTRHLHGSWYVTHIIEQVSPWILLKDVMFKIILFRWQAPISLSIYTCGSDFEKTIQSLVYLNYCLKQNVFMRRFLSIHLVFHSQHIPENLKRFEISFIDASNKCAKSAPFKKMRQDLTFWNKMKLTYPVNLLRNVARMNAETYYIMALDLQLVPPPNFVKNSWSSCRWDILIIPIFSCHTKG